MNVRGVKRISALLAATGCSVALFWYGSGFVREQVGQPIRYIDIEGALELHEQGIIEAQLSNLDRRKPDIARVKRDLERLDWIETASVRRVWPDGLRVSISKHRAIAHWGTEAYLNELGEVFSLPAPTAEKLPALTGPRGSEREVMAQYQQLAKAFQKTGQVIAGVTLSDRGEWLVQLKSGVGVRLGTDDISDRLLRLLKVFEETDLLARAEGIEEFDTRYTNGIAVRWKAGYCTDNCYQLADNANLKRVQTYERHGG